MTNAVSPLQQGLIVAPLQGTAPISKQRTLDDDDLDVWLKDCHKQKCLVTIVYAKHRCAFYDDSRPSELWPADPGPHSVKSLRLIAQAGRLRRVEVAEGALQGNATPDPGWSVSALGTDKDDLKRWFKARSALFDTGRGKPLPPAGGRRVWHDAAGRCMFRGCGVDLGRTSLTTELAAAGYLAHIVASDEDGPRGCPTDSHRLSADPENVMLMCDQHHRLIDRIDPDGYSVPVLRDMRREHAEIVRRSLDGLAFPRSKAIAVLGNVAGAWSQASEREIRQAMLDRDLACLPSVRYPIRRTQRDDRDQPDFWRHLLHEHARELDAFMRELGTPQEQDDHFDVLSVFPLHAVPVLLLAGRIVGEARRVEVFQYHRHRGTWRWEEGATPQPRGAFYLEGAGAGRASEVLLTLELTATADDQALPLELDAAVKSGAIPWVRIRAAHPNPSCIGHPDDLEQFNEIARQAIAAVQDGMRASKVHFIGLSPASTLFRFGQMLQAGHHCPYVVYDRPNHTTRFLSAMTIDGQQATDALAPGSGHPVRIQLR